MWRAVRQENWMAELAVRPLRANEADWARDRLRDRWGATRFVARGRLFEADQLAGLVAEAEDGPAGLLTYHIEDRSLQIVTLDAFDARGGVGRSLVAAVRFVAMEARCRDVWLVTTNDNVPAQEFYEALGFVLIAVHKNAIAASRELKPEIPHTGVGGVEIRDEIEYSVRLD